MKKMASPMKAKVPTLEIFTILKDVLKLYELEDDVIL